MNTATDRVLINGLPLRTIDVLDRGLSYGDGLFETLFVRDSHPQLWDYHLQRLQQGCERLSLLMPSPEQLLQDVKAVCDGLEQAVVKLTLTRGVGPRGYRIPESAEITRIVMASPFTSERHDDGVRLRWCNTRFGRNPAIAGLKHLNRLENVIARSEWRDTTIHEGLVRDSEGEVVGGTQSNLFIIKENTLLTPDLTNTGIAGTRRRWVMETARTLNMACQVQSLSPMDVESADALFVCNTVMGLAAVEWLEEKHYDGHPLLETLMQHYQQELG